jgi:hypothetical protein
MKRRVNETMAKALMWMYKHHHLSWVNMPTVAPRWAIRNREYTRLNYWGLVELQPNVDDPSKRTTGVWRVTSHGEQWLQGSVRIAQAVLVFDDQVIDQMPETIAVADCFGVHFDYAALMAGL